MPRGRRWADAENRLLLEMVEQGMNAQQIYNSGKLPGRSLRAIETQIQRFPFETQKKKFFATQISEAEIPEFEEVLARYVDAFNKLCEMTEYSKEDLERIRLIFQAVWKYRELYREYERWEELKVRVEKLAADVEMLKEMREKEGKAN